MNSAHIFRYVNHVNVNFAVLDQHARSLRALVGNLASQNNTRFNKNFTSKITYADHLQPTLEVHYTDKHVLRLNTREMSSTQIMDEIWQHARKLKNEEDIRVFCE
ncbi:hypothetical protein CXG81DRAFT_26969 [Caulochytrium protostelioides]|uniref:Ribosomal protein/NADH dehydrogenase domain-containing protein n=1 Tax=Caulochytrium protostelioides TaxID=1555241 RepID=A0A4P9WZT9_9FUNG|nr:hypothetical protein CAUPRSCDRAFT_10252 [Caulochytrium protostelioides]RKP00314.1 hypothetical protein CXG81DRAFT_26969 [Caulochytrium protostelioides]|eukprot:RKP00314.1 hypothetical protein CXG81DRAFT_26969 [Caulochytrium protostelioides]